MTYDEFLVRFDGKYFMSPIKEQKKAEFLLLDQGSYIVTEFEFVPFSHDEIDTNKTKTRNFLREAIKQVTTGNLTFTTYSQVVGSDLMYYYVQMDPKRKS